MKVGFRRVQQRSKAHPLVRVLVDKMNEQGVGVVEMCKEAGIARNSFGMWGRATSPKLTSIEACFNVLGYALAPVKVSTDVYNPEDRHKKTYRVTSPNGNDFEIIGLEEFCKKHRLDKTEMYRIANTQKSHKGWKVRK